MLPSRVAWRLCRSPSHQAELDKWRSVGRKPASRCMCSPAAAADKAPETIAVQRHDGYAIIELARPKSLNALSSQVMKELVAAARQLASEPLIKSIIITGQGRAFAAGADIKEMALKTGDEERLFAEWEELTKIHPPLIAAVNGYALGGGCELAMLCDIILASEDAVFGMPELSLGVIPGIGGMQRLTRLVGRAKAMDVILLGSRLAASEAERAGLVSRVVPRDQLMATAVAAATTIAGLSAPIVAEAAACISAADVDTLDVALETDRTAFWECFNMHDQKEGMAAFLEKRKPQFKDC